MRGIVFWGWICTLLVSGGAGWALTADRASIRASDHKSASFMLDNSEGVNWPSFGRTNGQQHYSPLTQVNTHNIGKLGLAWALDHQVGSNMAQPLAIDGVIYFSTGFFVIHAVDAATGKPLWTYDAFAENTMGEHSEAWAGWGPRGIGWLNGKIYAVTKYRKALALDGRTGKLLWQTDTMDKNDISYVTGAPYLFNGVLIIGNGGDNGRMRGHVVALDAETGKELWHFHTVPGDPSRGFESKAMEMASKTWSGRWWDFGGNGSPWNAFAYDPENGLLFVGTGNGYPYNYRFRSEGKGDNLSSLRSWHLI